MRESESRLVKTREVVEYFNLLENFHTLCRGFHQAMKTRRECVIPFIKLLYSNVFHKTVNFHNLETVNHIAHIIFVLLNAMKTHLLTNQNVRTIQIIL